MKLFNPIRRSVWLMGLMLLALLIIPAVHAQDTSDQILYAVQDENRNYTIYTVNVDDSVKTQIGTVHGQFDTGNDAGWSPDGKFIYLLDSQEPKYPTLTLVDAETNQRRTIPDPLEAYSCSLPLLWSPSGKWVAYTTQSDSQILLKLFNPSDGDIQTVSTLDANYNNDERGWFTSLSWSYDGRYLSYDDKGLGNYHANLYDVQNQRRIDVLSGLWSPTENKLVYANKSAAIIYDLLDGTKQQYKADRTGQWSPDGRFLTIYNEDKNEHKTLSVIDVHANKIINFEGEITALDFDSEVVWSSDGRFLAVTTRNEHTGWLKVYILDVVTRSIQHTNIETGNYPPLIWSPVGHQLAFISDYVSSEFGGDYTSLWLFDMDHQQSNRYAIKAYSDYWYKTFDWFADGRYMTVRTDGKTMLLDTTSKQFSLIGNSIQSNEFTYWWINKEGNEIALSKYWSSTDDIYLFAPEDKLFKNITNTPDEEKTFLGWRGSKNQQSLIQCGE